MNLSKRSYAKELLDQDDIPFAAIRQNMFELNRVNTLLGGHIITINGLKKVIGNQKELIICEIGCGGGDNMIALHKWCLSNNIHASFIGVDVKAECIEFAKTQMKGNTIWLVSDYRDVHFEKKPDVVFSSLFCHHFTDDELVTQVKWMQKNASIGFFINDLHRHPIAYRSIKLLTGAFSSSYLVKNDAPLSVARGFKKKEWISIFKAAGIQHYSLAWKWAFRYLISCCNDA